MSTSAFIVNGNWRSASSSAGSDLEAQTITGTRGSFTLPTALEPVRAAPTPVRTPYDTTAEAIDDFFGVTRPRATRESQHDLRLRPASLVPPPPPYADAELPAYSVDPSTEPVTLAMYLFKLGFLFPPFWIIGATVLISPLTAPAEFEPSKSGAERQLLVQIIRDAELKWAQRCAWALVVVFVLATTVAAIALGMSRS